MPRVWRRPRTSLRSPGAADHTIESGAAAAVPAPNPTPTRIQEVATAASRRRQRVGLIAGRSAESQGTFLAFIRRCRNWI
jgi:hypothetical protein